MSSVGKFKTNGSLHFFLFSVMLHAFVTKRVELRPFEKRRMLYTFAEQLKKNVSCVGGGGGGGVLQLWLMLNGTSFMFLMLFPYLCVR